MLKNKVFKRSIAVAVSLAVMLGTLFVSTMLVRAEEINETNPTDLKFYFIDSDLEQYFYGFPITEQTGELRQSGTSYEMDTNSMAAWSSRDDIAFAYKKYNVGVGNGDYIEATVTLDSYMQGVDGALVHRSATQGIMIRNSLDPESEMAFFGIREGGPCLVYRTKYGTQAASSSQFGDYLRFPVTIKIRKEGKAVKVAYKNDGDDFWNEFKYAVAMNGSGPLYVGLAAHSHNPEVENTAFFSDYNVTGVGSLSGDGSGGDSSGDDEVDEYIAPDAPLTDDVLLRETFSDKNLYNEPGYDDNGKLLDARMFPIWTRPSDEEPSFINDNGNIYWDLSSTTMHNYFGDTKMTDYKVSAKIRYSDFCNPEEPNAFRLYTRHTDVEFYGNADYYAQITNGNTLTFAKNVYIADGTDSGVTIKSVNIGDALGVSDYTIFDNEWHTLAIEALDDTFKVYLDDTLLIDVVDYDSDTGRPYSNQLSGYRVFANGNVGISVAQTFIAVDDIIITDIEDKIGGDFDNAIGGNWDEYQPGYVKDYFDKYSGIKFY